MADLCGTRSLIAMNGKERLEELECSLLRGHDGAHAHMDPKTGEVLYYFFIERKVPEPKPQLKIDRYTGGFRRRKKKEETLW